MKVTSYAVARPNYYDRGSTSAVQSYIATVAPHAFVARWTTTVASGKKLLVEITPCRILRVTVAAVSGSIESEIQLLTGASQLVMMSNYKTDNTVNVPYISDLQASYTMFAGEILKAFTGDASTGGTVQFSMVQKGTLFDE